MIHYANLTPPNGRSRNFYIERNKAGRKQYSSASSRSLWYMKKASFLSHHNTLWPPGLWTGCNEDRARWPGSSDRLSFSFSSQHPRRVLPRHPEDRLALLYRGPWAPCIIAAFCSWNRSFNRAEPFRFLSTQRRMHCSSRLTRDLVVKSLTQSSKQRWTILEYICVGVRHRCRGEVRNGTI